MIGKILPLPVFVTILAPLVMPVTAHAATVEFSLKSKAVVIGEGSDVDETNQFTPVGVLGNETGSIISSVGGSQASAGYSINQLTGAIKFGARSDLTASSLNFESEASSSVDLRLREDLVVSGTGNVTFRLDIEGGFDSSTLQATSLESPTVSAGMTLLTNGGNGPQVFKSDDLFLAGALNASTAVNETLEFSFSLNGASVAYQFVLDIASTSRVFERQGNTGISSADFFNTAFLSIVADDTITVTASDPLFLAGESSEPVSEVPLPATAWMFIASLAGLGLLRKRKAVS